MPEESTTPDLVELGSRFREAANRRDLDAMLGFFAPDAVWETMAAGLGTTFAGVAAIRRFFEDWWGSYDELWIEREEGLDLGNGVVFSVLIQRGRPIGSSGHVQLRWGSVGVWVGGLIVRITNYPDIEEARSAAERLAEERAQADA
jgi:ketosteroid isomerase-like protein